MKEHQKVKITIDIDESIAMETKSMFKLKDHVSEKVVKGKEFSSWMKTKQGLKEE